MKRVCKKKNIYTHTTYQLYTCSVCNTFGVGDLFRIVSYSTEIFFHPPNPIPYRHHPRGYDDLQFRNSYGYIHDNNTCTACTCTWPIFLSPAHVSIVRYIIIHSYTSANRAHKPFLYFTASKPPILFVSLSNLPRWISQWYIIRIVLPINVEVTEKTVDECNCMQLYATATVIWDNAYANNIIIWVGT